MAKATKTTKKMVSITRMRSAIGRPLVQKQTLRGLGLFKRGQTRQVEDTPSVRGMINAVKHLVRIEGEE